ncbi:MAG TPA: alpha/beta hydrolase [Acidimicrobiales bacterium]|nr:alpha/beta hydrolase [Acidimicrobiales bacterium]
MSTDAPLAPSSAELNGVRIGYLDVGEGPPIVWCHEYFGDYRSWAPQLSAFSRNYRNVVYSARGYPASSVPEEAGGYSQQLMIDDLLGLLDHLAIERAVVAGLSMGGNVALNFGLQHPERCLGLVIAGCGSGSSDRERFEQKAQAMLAVIENEGMAGLHRFMEGDPTRLPLKEKDPAGWAELGRRLADRSPSAAAHIYREVQLKRPGILTLGEQLEATEVPALVLFGDGDDGCVEPGLFMWRHLPDARLAVLPASGHCVNLEEPELFNALVRGFLDSLGLARP